MVLLPGAMKGSGLERLLALCGLSSRNLAAFGDAENDLSILTLAEVRSPWPMPFLPSSKQRMSLPQLQALKAYSLGGKFLDIPLTRERSILLGQAESGTAIHIPAAWLAGLNLGVFGNSATGKSWMVGLITEGLHHEDYQVLLIDPEGDFRGLCVLPLSSRSAATERPFPHPPPSPPSSRKEGYLSFSISANIR